LALDSTPPRDHLLNITQSKKQNLPRTLNERQREGSVWVFQAIRDVSLYVRAVFPLVTQTRGRRTIVGVGLISYPKDFLKKRGMREKALSPRSRNRPAIEVDPLYCMENSGLYTMFSLAKKKRVGCVEE